MVTDRCVLCNLSYPNVVVSAPPLLVPKCNSALWPTRIFSRCWLLWLNYSFYFYSWALLGIILARISYVQLISPAVHSLVLFGSTEALGVLTVCSSGEQPGWWPTPVFFKSIKNGSKFLWPILSAAMRRKKISKYIENPNEHRYCWQFIPYFLITKLLIKWLWYGRPNYAAQYTRKIQYFQFF